MRAPVAWVRLLFLVSFVLALGGCRRVEVDDARLGAVIQERASAVANRPEVVAALDRIFARVGADPEVKAAVTAIEALGNAPELAGPKARFEEGVAQAPHLKKFVEENAKLPEGALAAAIEKRMTETFEGPAFDRVLGSALSELFERPKVARATRDLAGLLTEGAALGASVSRALRQEETSQAFEDRLRKRLGWRGASRERATQLVADEVLTEARLGAFYVELYATPPVERGLVKVAAAILESKSFQKALVGAAKTCLQDPIVSTRLLAVIDLALTKPSEADLGAAVRQLLAAPALEQALVDLLQAATADPDVKARFRQLGEQIFDDPAAARALRVLLVDW